jgi:hypothetical protein
MFVMSCRTDMTKQEMLVYIDNPDNGLTQIKEVGSYRMKLSYRPTQMLFNNRENYNEKLKHFVFTISDNGEEVLSRFANERGVFNKLSDQLNFHMTDKIGLRVKGRNFKAYTCYHQATYGMTNETRFLLSFKKEHFTYGDEITIVLDEFGLNIGKQNFEFNNNKIKELSNINFSKNDAKD